MSELFIGRLTATAVAEPPTTDSTVSLAGPGSLSSRLPALLANLADHRLEEALAGAELPEGEWCLHRLDLRLVLDPDRPGPTLETQWAAALIQELQQRISSGSDEVLHFTRMSDAVNDMAAALITGRTDHAWAWRQLGLLMDQDPEPASAPAQLLLTHLRRWPARALSAVVAAVAAHGAAPLARLLGRRDWIDLAAIVATAAGVSGIASVRGNTPAPEVAGPSPSPGRPALAVKQQPGPANPAQLVERITGSLVGHSLLAKAFLRSGFRADPSTAAAWALLATAEFDAGLLHRADAPAILRSLSTRFLLASSESSHHGSEWKLTSDGPAIVSQEPGQPLSNTAGSTADEASTGRSNQALAIGGSTPPGPHTPVRAPSGTGPADTRALETEPRGLSGQIPEDVGSSAGDVFPLTTGSSAEILDPRGGIAPELAKPTLWAGLPFLLATADDAGIPGKLLADPALAGQPLRWILHQLGQLLVPAAPDDPAVMALAGLSPEAEPPARLGGSESIAGPESIAPVNPAHGGNSAERAALDRHATRWALATAGRLGRAHLEPFGVVSEIASRPGAILAQSGWIEVHLSLADVDVTVRRAGLDIDPGWIPWLGTVVRYVYS